MINLRIRTDGRELSEYCNVKITSEIIPSAHNSIIYEKSIDIIIIALYGPKKLNFPKNNNFHKPNTNLIVRLKIYHSFSSLSFMNNRTKRILKLVINNLLLINLLKRNVLVIYLNILSNYNLNYHSIVSSIFFTILNSRLPYKKIFITSNLAIFGKYIIVDPTNKEFYYSNGSLDIIRNDMNLNEIIYFNFNGQIRNLLVQSIIIFEKKTSLTNKFFRFSVTLYNLETF